MADGGVCIYDSVHSFLCLNRNARISVTDDNKYCVTHPCPRPGCLGTHTVNACQKIRMHRESRVAPTIRKTYVMSMDRPRTEKFEKTLRVAEYFFMEDMKEHVWVPSRIEGTCAHSAHCTGMDVVIVQGSGSAFARGYFPRIQPNEVIQLACADLFYMRTRGETAAFFGGRPGIDKQIADR